MRNGSPEPATIPEQPPQQQFTMEELHRQQRVHLAMRALDLEAENMMLQQEVRKLTARIAELEAVPAHPRDSLTAPRVQ